MCRRSSKAAAIASFAAAWAPASETPQRSQARERACAEERVVEVDVVRADHTVREGRDDSARDIAERRRASEGVVLDAVDLSASNMPPRMHERIKHDRRVVARANEYDRDLDHPVVLG